MKSNLHRYFKNIKDPRINRRKQHYLSDSIALTVIGIISGADSWDTIEDFGNAKIDFLSQFLSLPNGIPSHDTINRVFSLIDPVQFELGFIKWVKSLKNNDIDKEVIAIDGKQIRSSRDAFNNIKATHIVSAWANSNQLVLEQIKVEDKSNELRSTSRRPKLEYKLE